MSRMLYIQASPRGERSYSLGVANEFVKGYTAAHPDTNLKIINVFERELPPFDAVAVEGKYAIIHGTPASPETRAAFAKVVELIEEFKAADVYVFAVPMWNFGIPYALKHYLDLIIQPTHTFTVGEKGYQGLLENRRAFAAFARGGDYAGNPAVDFQEKYLQLALGFIGIKNLATLVVQPCLAGGREKAQELLATAKKKAEALGREF